MTQEDLDRMRDVTAERCALFQKEEDGAVEDIYGQWWMIGWIGDEHVKRKLDGAGLSC